VTRGKQPAGAGRLAHTTPAVTASDAPALWRSLVPYLFIPAVGALVGYAHFFAAQATALEQGVYVGGAILIGLVLIRQVLALRETTQARQALSAANSRLEALATTDMLTELPNHRALSNLLEQEGERARRYGHPLSLLFFDGDRFKQVNDTYGHAVGDAVLRELGERARSVLRAGDTLGRFGGEEFLVLLPETDGQGARTVAERLRAAVAAAPLAAQAVEGGIAVTVSIGVASYPADGASGSEVRGRADQAMYWAKRLGRNQVRTAEEAARAERDAALKAATAHMLERHEGSGDPDSRLRMEQLGLIYSLMGVLDWREPGMSAHAQEVSDLVAGMARALHFDEARTLRASTAAFLHDIGKIALPDRLLQQPRQHFSAQEWHLLHQHAELGAAIVEASHELADLAPAIRHHHERWDGAGDPDGLAGEAIPLEARLIGLAEAYHAMTSQRPYQAARTAAQAMAELERCGRTQFDPALLPVLRAVLASRQEAGTHAEESDRGELLTRAS
jgi:diguanylate cyclase (GGDEF)-like protein/putative nucleotidyltransferase with HDIG domain